MTRTLFATILLSTLAACGTDAQTPVDPPVAQQGRLTGELPLVGAFDDELSVSRAYSDGEWVDFHLEVQGEFGWAMVGGWGRIDARTGDVEEGGMIGCSGPDIGVADYDEPAIDTDILIDEVVIDGEIWLDIQVDGTFSGGEVVVGRTLVKSEAMWGPEPMPAPEF